MATQVQGCFVGSSGMYKAHESFTALWKGWKCFLWPTIYWGGNHAEIAQALNAEGREQKKILLLTEVGSQTIYTVTYLTGPQRDWDIPFTEVIQKLEKYFKLQSFEIVDSYKSGTHNQKMEETLSIILPRWKIYQAIIILESIYNAPERQIHMGVEWLKDLV